MQYRTSVEAKPLCVQCNRDCLIIHTHVPARNRDSSKFTDNDAQVYRFATSANNAFSPSGLHGSALIESMTILKVLSSDKIIILEWPHCK